MIDIYKASAGSGKTYTLVREYLKLLLGKKNDDGSYSLDAHPGKNHSGILAITFTNKATEEMKKRIVKELDILANSGGSPYADFLTTTYGTTLEKLREAAREALSGLLHDFTNFNVSTIDAFFQKILRTFAFESDLSGNYGVELNDDYVIAVGVSDLKQSLRVNGDGDNRLLLSWLERFIFDNIDNGDSWNVFSQGTGYGNKVSLPLFAKEMTKEVVKKQKDRLFEYLSDKNRLSGFVDCLNGEIRRLSGEIHTDARGVLAILSAPGVQPYVNFLKIIQPLAETGGPIRLDKLNGPSPARKYIGKTFVKKGSAPVSEIDITDALERIDSRYTKIRSYQMALNNVYFLGLLGDIEARVREFTKDNNVILLSGTNDMLKRIINKDDATFVYERVGMRLTNFLIDEFQDTSRMQWENLQPLLANSLDYGNDNLIIGDVKQSIYRFRNSDLELLRTQVKRDFPGLCREWGDSPEENTNWRSSRNVVEWNNGFFSWLAGEVGASDIYSNVSQNVCAKNKSVAGRVSVSLLGRSSEGQALEKLIADINSLIGRGYEQRDIAVIVDTKVDGQKVIGAIMDWNNSEAEKEGGAEKINVVSEESLLIANSAAVRIIVNTLSLLDCDNSDSSAGLMPAKAVRILNAYEKGKSEGMDPSEAFAKAVREANAEQAVDFDLSLLFGDGKSAGLDTIAEQIVRNCVPRQVLEENTPYIQAFMDCLIDYMSRYGSSIHSFLKWWKQAKDSLSISSPANTNAVKVMTVHKSKGLEFPCVILPFFDWKLDKKLGIDWVETADCPDGAFPAGADVPPLLPVRSKDYGEEAPTVFGDQLRKFHKDSVLDSLNKTYVACTRAVYEMIIYADETKGGSVAEMLSNFLKQGDDSKTEFERGEPTEKANAKKEQEGTTEEKTMPPYYVTYKPAIWNFESPDIISEVRGTPRYEGEVLHRIMRRVRKAADVDTAVRRFLARGVISGKEAEEYRGILEKGLSDSRVADWFAPENRLMNERTILDEKGGVYRPDRVVVRPDGRILVIDYKFGERQDKKYMRQVRNYMSIIGAAKNSPQQVEGYIWYVQEAEIVRVGG